MRRKRTEGKSRADIGFIYDMYASKMKEIRTIITNKPYTVYANFT